LTMHKQYKLFTHFTSGELGSFDLLPTRDLRSNDWDPLEAAHTLCISARHRWQSLSPMIDDITALVVDLHRALACGKQGKGTEIKKPTALRRLT